MGGIAKGKNHYAIMPTVRVSVCLRVHVCVSRTGGGRGRGGADQLVHVVRCVPTVGLARLACLAAVALPTSIPREMVPAPRVALDHARAPFEGEARFRAERNAVTALLVPRARNLLVTACARRSIWPRAVQSHVNAGHFDFAQPPAHAMHPRPKRGVASRDRA